MNRVQTFVFSDAMCKAIETLKAEYGYDVEHALNLAITTFASLLSCQKHGWSIGAMKIEGSEVKMIHAVFPHEEAYGHILKDEEEEFEGEEVKDITQSFSDGVDLGSEGSGEEEDD